MPALFGQAPSRVGGLGGLGGFMQNASSFREQNPGALTALGAGIMAGNPAAGFLAAAKPRVEAQRNNATAQYLLTKGIAKSPEEAMALAGQPELLRLAIKNPDEYSQRAEAWERYGGDPNDPQKQNFILGMKDMADAGNLPASVQEYEYGQKNPAYLDFMKSGKGRDSNLTVADKKAIFEAEDVLPAIEGTMSALNRAKELNTKTYTGYTAGARGWAGANLPGAGAVLDEQTSRDTLEFNNLMSYEAIKTMADTLKGATTDFELNKFVEILADPATPTDVRGRTIDRMIKLAERKKQVAEHRVRGLRTGDYYDTPAAASPAGNGGWTIEEQ